MGTPTKSPATGPSSTAPTLAPPPRPQHVCRPGGGCTGTQAKPGWRRRLPHGLSGDTARATNGQRQCGGRGMYADRATPRHARTTNWRIRQPRLRDPSDQPTKIHCGTVTVLAKAEAPHGAQTLVGKVGMPRRHRSPGAMCAYRRMQKPRCVLRHAAARRACNSSSSHLCRCPAVVKQRRWWQ